MIFLPLELHLLLSIYPPTHPSLAMPTYLFASGGSRCPSPRCRRRSRLRRSPPWCLYEWVGGWVGGWRGSMHAYMYDDERRRKQTCQVQGIAQEGDEEDVRGRGREGVPRSVHVQEDAGGRRRRWVFVCFKRRGRRRGPEKVLHVFAWLACLLALWWWGWVGGWRGVVVKTPRRQDFCIFRQRSPTKRQPTSSFFPLSHCPCAPQPALTRTRPACPW